MAMPTSPAAAPASTTAARSRAVRPMRPRGGGEAEEVIGGDDMTPPPAALRDRRALSPDPPVPTDE